MATKVNSTKLLMIPAATPLLSQYGVAYEN